MSDDAQISAAAPGRINIISLGAVDAGSVLSDPITKEPAGRALSWASLLEPDTDFEKTFECAVRADVAIIGFEQDPNRAMQLQRWAWMASQLAIPHLVMAVEIADLPPEGRKGFDALTRAFLSFVKEQCSFKSVTAIPISRTTSGNITSRDAGLGWYMGPTLLDHLNDCATEVFNDDSSKQESETVTSDHVQARVFWLSNEPLLPWRPLEFKSAHGVQSAAVSGIKYELDSNASRRVARNRLKQGDIGVCNVKITEAMPCVAFPADRQAGHFKLFDPDSGNVVGLGLIDFSLRRASNVRWQETTITPLERADQKQQSASVLWFTGLSGAGKSTIADLVEKRLKAAGKHTMLLDGDNVRHGLNKDLGFTDVDRVENIRRISEVSKLMCDAGLIVLVSFISPFRAERKLARDTVAEHGFCEIYVATPLAVAEKRDVKGLYAKARRGEIKNFTGIDSPYEPPKNPEITIDTSRESAEQAAERIVSQLLGA